VLTNQLQAMPSRKRVELVYGETFTRTTAGAVNTAPTAYTFRLGSLFDPDYTSAGHQPYGFDQWAAFFNKYIVHEATVEVCAYDPSADGLLAVMQIQAPNDTNGITGKTAAYALESPNVHCVPLSNTGDQRAIWRIRVPLHQLVGRTKAQYLAEFDDYGAVVSTNPTLPTYVNFTTIDPSAGAAASVKFAVRITYVAELFEPVNLTQS